MCCKYKVLTIAIIMLGFWFGIGVILYYHDSNNFISDWINSAAAIGTFWAVITSLYLANRTIPRDKYISIASASLTVQADNNYIGFECLILNNMNFEITVRSIRVQINEYILFLTEFEASVFQNNITIREIPSNKIISFRADQLFWINDSYQPIYYDLPDNLISYLINNKRAQIMLYVDSDVYLYQIRSKVFKKSIESIGNLRSYTQIKFEF